MTLVFFTGLAVEAFQGMGGAQRPVPPPKRIETTLPPIKVDFRDIAGQAGLTATNVSGGADAKKYILETTGNGVATFDFDNDGLIDVFLPNATTLDGDGPGATSTSHLYRNLGRLKFEDVTANAGVGRVGWGQGACFGDFDNDGYRDLFVTYYGQSVLYRNQRDGRFNDATEAAGLKAPSTRWDTGCSFVDYDRDGRLDLVVTNYLEFNRSKVPEAGSGSYCLWKGMPVMCGPRGLPFARNYLFHNEGEGRFSDVSTASGVGRTRGCYGFTVVPSDLDNDGWPDLYVACDSTPSLLYHNQKDGTFKEVGLLSGVALNEDGQEQGGMGVAVADYDDDGYVDIVKTNFSDDIPNLYHNNGDGTFEDRVLQSGLGTYMEYVGWGVHFLDVDHDGRKDLLVINGHVYPEVERSPEIKYRQPRLLYWNVGGGRFKDVSSTAGPGVRTPASSRGSAVADFDNDGSLEVVVMNMGGQPSLLDNVGEHKNWLTIQCLGTASGLDAFGTRLRLYVGDRVLSGEVQAASGFVSQGDPRVHFGLGADAAYQRIEVRWPNGKQERFGGGKANQIVVLKEGSGPL